MIGAAELGVRNIKYLVPRSPQSIFSEFLFTTNLLKNFMFQISYDEGSNIVTAITSDAYDAQIAKEQMHQIIDIPNLPETIRVLRIYRKVSFSFTPAEVKEHFDYVQNQLNNTHIKNCFLAVVTDNPLNTALGFLYQSNRTTGSCFYIAHVFSTEEAATKWLMGN